MTDDALSADELKTLQSFQHSAYPDQVDPHHLAKLLSLALIEQHEGGDRLSILGKKLLNSAGLQLEGHPAGE